MIGTLYSAPNSIVRPIVRTIASLPRAVPSNPSGGLLSRIAIAFALVSAGVGVAVLMAAG